MTQQQRIVLAGRPQGDPGPEHFRLETAPLPDPGAGEFAVRIIWLSLDPYMRGRMDAGASYVDPVEVGAPMAGGAVGQVTASNNARFAVGDVVMGYFGWVSAAISDGTGVRKLDPSVAPISTALGVLGMPGLTAWAGLTRVAEAQPGETVVISAATGAVGSVAGQLAKARGMTVIGVAGGAEKCAYAVDTLGFDACLDHRAAPDARALSSAIKEAAPQGIDVYFENVGGKTLQAVIPRMNQGGRIAVCGMIAWYSGVAEGSAAPLPFVWRSILVKRLRVQGFIVTDYQQDTGAFVKEAAPMLADGRIQYRETVAEGLENAPAAFLDMLKGGNFGKQLVRVGPDPD